MVPRELSSSRVTRAFWDVLQQAVVRISTFHMPPSGDPKDSSHDPLRSMPFWASLKYSERNHYMATTTHKFNKAELCVWPWAETSCISILQPSC